MRHTKKVWPINRNCPQVSMAVELLDKYFKSATTNMVQKLKETTSEELEYENDVSLNRDYQSNNKNYRREPSRKSGDEKCKN